MCKKITIDEVKQYAIKQNFEVLDDVYINIKTAMKFKCIECNQVTICTFDNLKIHHKCNICRQKKVEESQKILKLEKDNKTILKNKIKMEGIRQFISNNNIELISTEWDKGVKSWTHLKCKECGNSFDRALSEFKGRKLFVCRECSGAGKLVTYEDIKMELDDNNIELISNEYTDNQQKLRVKCSVGHETYRSISKIRRSNYTCPYCNRKGYKRTTEILAKEIEEITNGEYELISEYKTMNDHVTLFHTKCGHKWETNPHAFLDGGTRCPLCNESKGERNIKEWLELNKINYTWQYIFDDLFGDHANLKFDFAVLNKDDSLKFLIEYDGEFHYMPIMGRSELDKQQRYDGYKDKYCKDNNIFLLRIPYWDFDKLEEILSNNILNK